MLPSTSQENNVKELKSKPELYSWQDCLDFKIEDIYDLYSKFVNKGQAELIRSFGFGRLVAESAEGIFINTKEGRRIYDFTGGVGVLGHGHNHPRILKARKEFQEQKRMEVHKNFLSPYVAGLSHNISKLLPEGMDISYFANSGAESVEGAVKLAYKFHDGKRKHILHSNMSFHGKLLGSAGLTASPEILYKWPTIPNTHPFIYGDINSIETLVSTLRKENGDSDIYALIIEPFSASNLQACSDDFLLSLRQVCDRENIILIFDEVFTGWAKTGSMFYFMQTPVVPDVVTYSKTFGGGKSSIAGYTAKSKVFNKAYGSLNDCILHSTTYNGFGEECITAIEGLNIIVEEDYVRRANEINNYLRPKLENLKNKYPEFIKEVRGVGILSGLVLNCDVNIALRSAIKFVPLSLFDDPLFSKKLVTSSIISELFNEFDILTYYGSNHDIPLMLVPPHEVDFKHLDYLVDSLDKVFQRGKNTLLVKFATYKFLKKSA